MDKKSKGFKKPTLCIHGYKYPEGRFQTAMSMIVATMSGNRKSLYYDERCLDGVDLSNVVAIMKLQDAYDMIHDMDRPLALKVRGRFYKILRDITGFTFDKHKKKKKKKKDKMKWLTTTDI